MLTPAQVREYKDKYGLNKHPGVSSTQTTFEAKPGFLERTGQIAAQELQTSGQKGSEYLSKTIEAAKAGNIPKAYIQGAYAGGEVLGGAARTALSPVASGVEKGIELISKIPRGEYVAPETKGPKVDWSPVIEKITEVANKYPDQARLAQNLFDFLTLGIGGKVAKPLEEVAGKTGKNLLESGVEKAGQILKSAKETLFGTDKPIKTVDDVIMQADSALKASPETLLSASERATAKPSLLERWSGLRPDIKNRIAGKQEKLKEYFDVAHARNNFDTLPTPLEYGAKNVDTAVSKMESLLADTGSDIGKFRKKIGTYKATIDDVGSIEKSFSKQLSNLNLEVKNGTIIQKPGTVTRVSSQNEIGVLNDLYGNLQVVKQSPTLENLIDLRNLFDQKINFAKSAREVSGSLDPLSRTIRKNIAEVGAKIVGKSEAANLTKYSDFMDAYTSLRSFTDRKAGAEFLLKQVLSERGAVPREVMQIIKEITGIDLMDDAVMASISTDLIGNSAQKGVFRQELIKAGLDASKILKGDTVGAIEAMFNFGKKALINEENVFLKAAK